MATQTDFVAAATYAATASPAATFAATSAPSHVVPAPVVIYAASAPVIESVIEYIAPARAVTRAVPCQPPVYTTETSAPQVIGSLPPFEEFDAPVYNQVKSGTDPCCSRAPVFEYVAPAPVTERIAPAPAVTSDGHSQQLPPVYTTTTVTTDVNLDILGLVYPQLSSTAVEPFSPQVVGSLPPLKRV